MHAYTTTLAYVEPESTTSATASTMPTMLQQDASARIIPSDGGYLSVLSSTVDAATTPLINHDEEPSPWLVIVVTADQGPQPTGARSTPPPVDETILDDFLTDNDQLLTDELLDALTS